MVKEDRLKNLLSHKSLLILIKYIPHIIAVAYAIYTFLGIFGIDYNIFGCFFHVSFLTWMVLYCLSIVFKYCYVHRLPIYYIGANELITCLDYYLDIELDYFTFITISLLMSCILIFGYSYYYINKLKMRDKKKFYVPKHIKKPQPGDYEVTLNWGDKVYVEKKEFEKKTSKFFKNYQVVEGDSDIQSNYFTIIIPAGTYPTLSYCSKHNRMQLYYSVNNNPWKLLNTTGDNHSSVPLSSYVDLSHGPIDTDIKIRFKGYSRYNTANVPVYVPPIPILQFSSNTTIKAEGNILSLMFSDDFKNIKSIEDVFSYQVPEPTELPEGETNITNMAWSPENIGVPMLFKDASALTDISNLIFPDFNCDISNNHYIVYTNMFENCSNVRESPELSASVINGYAYRDMFDGCSSLNYIKCLATTAYSGVLQDSVFAYNWITNISQTGTFVKASGANWETGINGIPEGWTVIEV